MCKSVVRRSLRVFLFAAVGASLQAPASAQSLSKAEAILGAPSALEALLAQQNGTPVVANPPVRPASYGYSSPTTVTVPATLREGRAASSGVTNGRPDIFGSIALRVRKTMLDARWRRVERSGVSGAAARFAESLRGEGAFERLEAVNWYVNKRVRFTDDDLRFGRADIWSSANETLGRGKGDCEDYAIAKRALLRRAGIADRDLYLVVLRDLVRRADHAVLVVRAAGHMYVLDNGTDQLLDTETIRDYRPIITFAAGATFTHGYRVRQPAVNIANAEEPTPAPAANTIGS